MVSAVASLSRPSPWIRVIRLPGRPARRPTASAATGSGGATAAPSATPAASVAPVDEQVEADADQQRGGQHQQHRQADHGAQVAPDVEQRGVQRGAVEQRRDDERQDELGFERDVRPGQQRVDDADDRQQRGRGQPGPAARPSAPPRSRPTAPRTNSRISSTMHAVHPSASRPRTAARPATEKWTQ